MNDPRYSREVLALARLRRAARAASSPGGASEAEVRLIAAELRDAANVLDNAGVFASIDRQTDYAQPDQILGADARFRHPSGRDLNPRAPHGTLGERYGTGPENIQPLTPLTQDQARGLFGDTEENDGRF